MVCNKCGAKVQSSVMCSICGNSKIAQSSAVEIIQAEEAPHKVSNLLKIYLIFSFVANTIALIMLLILISTAILRPLRDPISPNVLIKILLISFVFFALELILMFFIIKRKKWAINFFIIIKIISFIAYLVQGQFLLIIFGVALLTIVLMNDYKYFT